MSNQTERNPFADWAILELMGHRRLAGYVTEQEIAGAGFLRIDVPGTDGPTASQFYSPSAVYCMTPTTEAMARAVARTCQPEPVQRWELALPEAREEAEEEDDDADANRRCRICGCTEHRPCPGNCTWVEWDLCSACVGAEKQA